MHGRIVQISENRIPEENFLQEDRYYEHWLYYRMDYIDRMYEDDENGRRKELKDIFEGVQGIAFDASEMTLTVEDKQAYFKAGYHAFMAKLEQLRQATLEDFSSQKLNFTVFELSCAYDDEYALYVDDDGEGYGVMTFNAWLRYQNNGAKVYLGSVFDYHY